MVPPNCRSNGGTTRRAQEIFPLDEGCLPCYAPAYFHRGAAHLFPHSRREWETQKLPSKKKRWEQCLYSGFHGNSNPKGFPKPPGVMAGQSGKRGRFFSPAWAGSPVMHQCIFAEGWPFLLLNPEWDGNTKLPLLLQKVGVVSIKAKPIDKAGGKKTERGWEEHPAFCHNHCE